MDFNPSDLKFDFEKGFTMAFDLKTGLSPDKETGKRYLSEMKGMFADSAAEEKMIAEGNPLVYEFHGMPAPEHPGDLAFGCSICYPGKVGDEYFMTQGHFHTILETGEVYYCLSGHGYMLLENPEGDWRALELEAGKAVYVPKRYAHRSINVSPDEPLVTLRGVLLYGVVPRVIELIAISVICLSVTNKLQQLITSLVQKNNELYNEQQTLVSSLAEMVESRNRETGQHIKRVAAYTEVLCRALGL